MFAKCSGASCYPGCTLAPPPQQLCGQPSPPAPSPTLLISLKNCVIQPSGELETTHTDPSPPPRPPTRLAAPRRHECSSLLGEEPHPPVCVPETTGPGAAWCVASGPSRASLPGCSVTHGDQVLHQNKTAPDSKQAFVQTLGNSSPLQSRQADSGSKK